MKVPINQLTLTLHTKDGQDVLFQDEDGNSIASMALNGLERGTRMLNVNGDLIASRSVMYAKVEKSKAYKCIPPTCPSSCAELEPPTIDAPTEPLTIEVGEEFDPLDGVSAFDGNCKKLTVTVTLEKQGE